MGRKLADWRIRQKHLQDNRELVAREPNAETNDVVTKKEVVQTVALGPDVRLWGARNHLRPPAPKSAVKTGWSCVRKCKRVSILQRSSNPLCRSVGALIRNVEKESERSE